MQVILSANCTCTPEHLWHGSLVRVPPFTKREAAALILLTLSSEEDMIKHWLTTNFFFVLVNHRDNKP
jgi:hypothetical protein